MTTTRESSVAASFAISSRAIVCADEVVSGTVVIEAGRIAGLERRSATRSAIEWGDDYLIPGLVELHTDHLEPHYSPRPKVCLLYTSPSPRDGLLSRMPSSA